MNFSGDKWNLWDLVGLVGFIGICSDVKRFHGMCSDCMGFTPWDLAVSKRIYAMEHTATSIWCQKWGDHPQNNLIVGECDE